MIWSIEDRDPPWSLPWGIVYEPNSVSIDDPNVSRKACHAPVGTWSKRVFTIVNPCGKTDDDLFVCVPEPGGEFTASGGFRRSEDCIHALTLP